MSRYLPVAILLLGTQISHADGLDISLGSDSAALTYLTDSSSFGYGGADVGTGIFFNEDSDYLRELKRLWDARLKDAFRQLPPPAWAEHWDQSSRDERNDNPGQR